MCQLLKAGKHFDHLFQRQININVPVLMKVSMDIKEMPFLGHMLVLLCKTSNFVVLASLKSTKVVDVCKVIKMNFTAHYGPPECIICDQDPAFMLNLTGYFTKHFGFKIYTVGATNYKSLLAEHGIKSLSSLLRNVMAQAGKDGICTWMKLCRHTTHMLCQI